MSLTRTRLENPGGGGSGGGGSRRILATTLTLTGTTSARPNQVSAIVTGTLPDPATILPGGSLQSIEYQAISSVVYAFDLTYLSIGAVNDAEVPFRFSFSCSLAGTMNFQGSHLQSISSSSTFAAVSQTRNFPANVCFDGTLVSTWGFTPSISLRIGEPNYGRETGTGSVAQDIVYNNLSMTGSVKVYYLFE